MPLILDSDVHDGFYQGIANRTLWPALHGIYVEEKPSWWPAYERCNRGAAEAVARLAPAGATVWVHDYHFLLVPAALAAARPDVRIAVFLHTPFDAATFRSLATWRPLMAGLRRAHVVGVQTPHDAVELRAALDSGERPSEDPEIVVAPAPVDAARLDALAARPGVPALASRIRDDVGADRHGAGGAGGASGAGSRQLLVGLDRLDYTTGIRHRLLAVEHLLDRRATRRSTLRATLRSARRSPSRAPPSLPAPWSPESVSPEGMISARVHEFGRGSRERS